MPHFGLIDENIRNTADYSILRSRIHVRTARRQLGEQKLQAGIGVYYDALHYGVVWYAQQHYRSVSTINIEDEFEAFSLLKQYKVIPEKYQLETFEAAMEAALEGNFSGYQDVIAQIDDILTLLGILPCDFNELPPEPPGIH